MQKSPRQKHPNETYLSGLREHDQRITLSIYREFRPGIINHVVRNSGSEQDGEDIFQSGLMVIYRKLRKGELVLSCAFYTFLFEICKRLWWKVLRKRKREAGVTIEDLEVSTEAEEVLEELMEEERMRLYRDKLGQLGEVCRKLLTLVLIKGKSMQEAAEQMGYKSAGMAKSKKYKCKQRLVDMIQSDPIYQELKR